MEIGMIINLTMTTPLVSFQPTSLPTALVFYMDYKYGFGNPFSSCSVSDLLSFLESRSQMLGTAPRNKTYPNDIVYIIESLRNRLDLVHSLNRTKV